MLGACVELMNADHSWEQERSRVQLAVIKLTDGSFAELEDCIDMARTDYRDVLAYAEYPEAMKLGFAAGSQLSAHQPDELSSIRARDRRQYEAWLTGDVDK